MAHWIFFTNQSLIQNVRPTRVKHSLEYYGVLLVPSPPKAFMALRIPFCFYRHRYLRHFSMHPPTSSRYSFLGKAVRAYPT